MVSTVSSNRQSNVQEILAWVLLVGLGVLFVGMFAIFAMFLYPRQEVDSLGALSAFPPANTPYKVMIQGENPTVEWVFLVNIEGELTVLSPIAPNSTHCRIVWEAANRRFADPCGGATFALNGGYLWGPAWANMGTYWIETTESGELTVDLNQIESETKDQSLTRCLDGLKLGAYVVNEDAVGCGLPTTPPNIQFFGASAPK